MLMRVTGDECHLRKKTVKIDKKSDREHLGNLF